MTILNRAEDVDDLAFLRPFPIHPSGPPSAENVAACLSADLWDLVLAKLEESGTESLGGDTTRICVGLRIAERGVGRKVGDMGMGPAEDGLRTILCWAKKAPWAQEDRPTTTLYISPSLYPSLPSEVRAALSTTSPSSKGKSPFRQAFIRPITPLPLSSLVVLASDKAAYELASSVDGQRRIREWLSIDQRIVRQGGILDIPDETSQIRRFKVLMAEPVLQGIFSYSTRLYITFDKEEQIEVNGYGHGHDSESESASGLDRQPNGLMNGYHSDSNGDKDEIEDARADEHETADDAHETDDLDLDELGDALDIGEDFLAASIADGFGGQGNQERKKVNGVNGSTSDGQHVRPQRAQTKVFKPIPLSTRILPQELIPTPGESDDDGLQLILRTSDIAKLGMFSGDWAILQKRDSEESRIARIFTCDAAFKGLQVPSSPCCLLSPLLSRNLGVKTFQTTNLTESDETGLSIRPLPGPNFDFVSSMPVAKAVTVARVASAHSVHRQYQRLFLMGLKDYFQHKKRCVKQGDLIAVPIDEGKARFVFDAKPASEGEEEGEGEEHGEFEHPQETDRNTAVVFFKITNVEVEGSSEHSIGDLLDVGEQIASGSLGCLVDPQVTKMVQTGLEHSDVPDVSGYFGIDEDPEPTFVSNNSGADSSRSSSLSLLDYVAASLRPDTCDYDLKLSVLLKGARGSGKRTLARWIARRAGFHLIETSCFDLVGETEVKTEAFLRAKFEQAFSCAPCILLLDHVDALAKKSQAVETGQEPSIVASLQDCFELAGQAWKTSGYPVVVFATTTDPDKLPLGVLGCFKEEIELSPPAEPERLSILRSLLRGDIISPDVSLRSLAVQTAALVPADLVDLVRRAKSVSAGRVRKLSTVNPLDLRYAGLPLTSSDFNTALDAARTSYSESIGAPKIPNVTWDDVGGLASVKSDILDTIQLPLDHPELFADGLKKRSGILLYGPPGTGKTLLAKAVATSCSLNFFSVKGPELLNMYIGESEANVRRVFQRARDAKPCVIFFDELDSVAPKRGNQGDSGGVMDRIVSQLLAELDGMSDGKGGSDVFVIGATNRPDLLDPALLRPGRFDRMLYLGVSDTHDAQLRIIEALTRKFRLDPNIDLTEIAEQCPFNYTGADFYALCSDAMLKAMTRKAEEVDARIRALNAEPPYSEGHPLTPQLYLAEIATAAEIEVLVAQQDFERALAELVPSVSAAEMAHYRTIQGRFSGQGQAVSDSKGKGKARA